MKRVALPAPGVRFDERFAARLERVVLRLRSVSERREGHGRGAGIGGGLEFVGYRPYRPGEDLRQLDWDLYARLDRPYVRLTRQEASERWVVLVDASGSMGLGAPGKLQAAAEVALALSAVAVAAGAVCELRVFPGAACFVARRQADLWACMKVLGDVRAGGVFDGFARAAGTLRGARRVFVVSDGAGAQPAQLAGLLGRGRALGFVQLLAQEELLPAGRGPTRFVDAEGGEVREVPLDRARVLGYQAELEHWLGGWRHTCARHRILHGVWSSKTPFEEILLELGR